MELTSITPSPTALRALSHPGRLRMLGLLRMDGPATATSLAARLGLNSGATSYHLRQLAQHGFIEEDTQRGNARERWWRAVHHATDHGSDVPRDEAGKEALDAYLQTVAVVETELLQRAIEERGLLPDAWREASEFGDAVLRLTPRRARALVDALMAAVLETTEDDGDEEAGEFVLQLHAFPLPGRLGGTGPGGTAEARQ